MAWRGDYLKYVITIAIRVAIRKIEQVGLVFKRKSFCRDLIAVCVAFLHAAFVIGA